MRTPTYVNVSGLSIAYASEGNQLLAADDISLSIRRGAFVSVVGPSGCGKTTLMMAVAGLIQPTSGTITIDGNVVRGPQTDLGIVFQKDVLLDWRRVLDNVLLQIDLRGLPRRQHEARARELLAMVGLKGMESKYPWELSGGMRQRVAVCRGLVHNPPLILMDEPFGALDALTREQLNLDLIDLWQGSDATVLFITHSLSEAVFLSDQVVVMSPRPGRVVDIIDIELPRPRDLSIRETPEFAVYIGQIRAKFDEMGVFHGRSRAR